jgi:hypothetical protein
MHSSTDKQTDENCVITVSINDSLASSSVDDGSSSDSGATDKRNELETG